MCTFEKASMLPPRMEAEKVTDGLLKISPIEVSMYNMPPWREYQKEIAKTMLRNLNRSTIFKWNISLENFRVSWKFYMFVSLIKFDIFCFFSKYLISLKRSQHNHTQTTHEKNLRLCCCLLINKLGPIEQNCPIHDFVNRTST